MFQLLVIIRSMIILFLHYLQHLLLTHWNTNLILLKKKKTNSKHEIPRLPRCRHCRPRPHCHRCPRQRWAPTLLRLPTWKGRETVVHAVLLLMQKWFVRHSLRFLQGFHRVVFSSRATQWVHPNKKKFLIKNVFPYDSVENNHEKDQKVWLVKTTRIMLLLAWMRSFCLCMLIKGGTWHYIYWHLLLKEPRLVSSSYLHTACGIFVLLFYFLIRMLQNVCVLPINFLFFPGSFRASCHFCYDTMRNWEINKMYPGINDSEQ